MVLNCMVLKMHTNALGENLRLQETVRLCNALSIYIFNIDPIYIFNIDSIYIS